MTVKSRHKWHCQLFCEDYLLLTVTFKVQSLLHLKELSYPLANGNNSFNLHWKYSQGMEWYVHDPGGVGPPSRPCPPFDSLMRVLLSFHLGWLTKKKKGHSRKIQLPIEPNPLKRLAWIKYQFPNSRSWGTGGPHFSDFVSFSCPFHFPLSLPQPTARPCVSLTGCKARIPPLF